MALVEEVVQEYRTSLADLIVNSKPLINMLTMLADDNEQHAPFIVEVIEDHISKVDEKTRASMYKLRQTWVDIVTPQKLYKIDVQIHNFLDPAWPITAPPPEQNSIHVNPKFLAKASSDSERSSPEVVVEEEGGEEEEMVEEEEEEEDQEVLLRKQVIAKQQELLKIKQASIELELAEAQEQMRKCKKQAIKPVAVPAAVAAKPHSTKKQLSPKSVKGVDVPTLPRDPRLAAGAAVSRRDPRLARTSMSSTVTPSSMNNPLVSSSLSSFPASSTHPGLTHAVGSPPYGSAMLPFNGLPVSQPGLVSSGQSDVFMGEVYNSPDNGARFSDDSESSMSSWQEIRNLPAHSTSSINNRDPRFRGKSEEESKGHHSDSHTRRNQHAESIKHPVTSSSRHHHGNSSKHYSEARHHTDAHKHAPQESGRSHHSAGKHAEDKVQRHSSSTSAKDVNIESREREHVSKEQDRHSKERESVSPRQHTSSSVSPRQLTSSHATTHKSSNSHHTSKHPSPTAAKDTKPENVRENKDNDKHKTIPEKRKSDSNSRTKVSASKSSSSSLSSSSSSKSSSKTELVEKNSSSSSSRSSSKSSSKTELIEKSRSGSKSSDNGSEKMQKNVIGSSNQQQTVKDTSTEQRTKRDDVKNKDSKTSSKDVGSKSDTSIEKKVDKSKRDSRASGNTDNARHIKQEVMDTDEPVSAGRRSPVTPVDKGEKRSSSNEATPRVIKKLKMEIDAENDNNNSTCDSTVKMEISETDSDPRVANDISDLFGSEDQDYRSVDQKGLPMKSPSSKGWDTFKAQHADEFAHDIQLKKEREEIRKRDDEPQDTDYRQTQRQMSTASDDSNMENEIKNILDHNAEILLAAHKRLEEGSITLEQHQELIRNLGELMQVQKNMTELSSPESEAKAAFINAHKQLEEGSITLEQHQELIRNLGELMQVQKNMTELSSPESEAKAAGQDTSVESQDIDSDLRNTSPRCEEPDRPRQSHSPERPLERFRIPKRREGSPRKDARGELQNLYPELPSQEPGARGRLFPENDPRGERRGPPARGLERGEPVDSEKREKTWEAVSPDKARRGESEEAGWRGPPGGGGEFDRREEFDTREPQGPGPKRDPRERHINRRVDAERSAPHMDTDRAGLLDGGHARGPPGRGQPSEFRRGPPGPLRRGPPPHDLKPGRSREDFHRQGPPEFHGQGSPAEFDRGEPQGEYDDWGPASEFDRAAAPPGQFVNRHPGEPRPLAPTHRPEGFGRGMRDHPHREPHPLPPTRRPEGFGRGHPRGSPSGEHEDWNREEQEGPRGAPEELLEGHPDWRPPHHRRQHPEGRPPHGPDMRRMEAEEGPWIGSPNDDIPLGPDSPCPQHWVNPPPGPPMRRGARLTPPLEGPGPIGPRGPAPDRFRGPHGSPFNDFADHPPSQEMLRGPDMIENEQMAETFDPITGLPPWEPVKRSQGEQDAPERKKRKGDVSEQAGIDLEQAEMEQGNAPGFHKGPFRPRPPLQEGPARFPGPPSLGPPPFHGPPPQELHDGPPGHRREPDPHRPPPDMMGPGGPPHRGGQNNGPPPPHRGPPDCRPEEPDIRNHTEHLPAFLGPANPKPRAFRDKKGAPPDGKHPGAPRHERGPRMQVPPLMRPAAPHRPPFNGPVRHGAPPRGPTPLFPGEPQTPLRGPHPPMESYVDMNGDPRFRSFVDMSPEVSEEVVLGKKNYEIKLGAPPRRIQWGTDFIEVYADPSKRGVIVDGILMYKFGERVKEVQIRGRKEKIFYHGKPLNLWIEGQSYEVRVDSPPKAIFINNKPHRIQVDGRDMMILIDKEEKGRFGGPPRFIFIDSDRMEIRFDPPPRHILIDGKLCELKLNMAQPCVNIEGKLHGIRFDGPPRDVYINGVLFKIFTDHAVKLRVGNRPHYVALGGPCHELIVDGKWFEVKFNEPQKEITVGNTVLFVQLQGPPPEVKILPELPHQPPMLMPGPPNGAPMQPLPGMGPPHMMLGPPPGLPPASMPGMMVPMSTADMGMPPPPLPLGVSQPMSLPSSMTSQTPSLPSSLTSLFQAGPPPAQQAASGPSMDLNSLLARLVSTGIISQDTKPVLSLVPSATPAAGPVKQEAKKETEEPILPLEFANIKKKHLKEEETFEDIPDMTEMHLSAMKIVPAGAIQRMYAGVQCTSCGSRFRLEDDEKAERYRQHLDWHFRQNKRDKTDTHVVRCRKWYYGTMDWVQYEEIGETEEIGKSSLFEQQQQVTAPSQPSQPHDSLITLPEGASVMKCPPATGDDNDDLCDICHEPFEQYWDEEHEQWHLRAAIRVNGKTYHPICYEDYTDVSEGTPSPSVLNVTEPNFSGMKNNYDEMSQDGLPHSSFEEERGAIKTEPKSTSESNIVMKLEPVFREEGMVTDEEEAAPAEPVPAASYTAVTVKTEPVEQVEAVKAEPMDTETVTQESAIVDTPSDDTPELTADIEPSKSYEKTGVLPGLDIKPEPVTDTGVLPCLDIEPETIMETDGSPGLDNELQPDTKTGVLPGLDMETESDTKTGGLPGLDMDTEPVTKTGGLPGLDMDTEPATKTGVLSGLDMEPEPVLEGTDTEVKTEKESQSSAIEKENVEKVSEERTEKTTKTSEIDSSLEDLGADIVNVGDVVKEEDNAAVETEASAVEERDVQVSHTSAIPGVGSAMEEETSGDELDTKPQVSGDELKIPEVSDEFKFKSEVSDELETPEVSDALEINPGLSRFAPLTALSRVKLARPSEMPEVISEDVLEIESNASTPTRDELPSPPSEEC